MSENGGEILGDLARRAQLGAPVAQESRSDGRLISLHVQRETGQLWLLHGDLVMGGTALAGGIEPVATAMVDDTLVAGGQAPARVAEIEVELGDSRRCVRPNRKGAWLAVFEHVYLPATLRVCSRDGGGTPLDEYFFSFPESRTAGLSRLWHVMKRRLRRYEGRRLVSY